MCRGFVGQQCLPERNSRHVIVGFGPPKTRRARRWEKRRFQYAKDNARTNGNKSFEKRRTNISVVNVAKNRCRRGRGFTGRFHVIHTNDGDFRQK